MRLINFESTGYTKYMLGGVYIYRGKYKNVVDNEWKGCLFVLVENRNGAISKKGGFDLLGIWWWRFIWDFV